MDLYEFKKTLQDKKIISPILEEESNSSKKLLLLLLLIHQT